MLPLFAKAQTKDTTMREIGVSMNQFGSILVFYSYLYIDGGNKDGGIYPAIDGYGLNFKCKKKHKPINRVGINLNKGLLITASLEKFISGNFYVGHEFFAKKRLKNFYCGLDVVVRRNITYFGQISTHYNWLTEIGPFAFVGYKVKLTKHLSLRTEGNFGFIVQWLRYFNNKNKFNFGYGVDLYKMGSIELNYNF